MNHWRVVLAIPLITICPNVLGTSQNEEKPRIAIIVDPRVYDSIQHDLIIYQNDIRRLAYSVIVSKKKWPNAFALRSALQKEYKKGLVGCVLVGDIPVPNILRDKDSEPRPCVLALMDLDGEWKKDRTGTHYTQEPQQPGILPEIWVSVIAPNSSREKPSVQLKRYFRKLHSFRAAQHKSVEPAKALSFVEYNWKRFTTMGLEVLYDKDVHVLREPEDTTPERLATELGKHYQFVTIEGHNNGAFTGMNISDHNGKRDDLGRAEIARIKPRTPFYSLFSCSVCCHTKTDYLGGLLLFDTPGGVLVHGTTMPGGMNSPQVLYNEWLKHGSYGEAFRQWFIHEIPRDAKATKRRWYLGAIILGDPTLSFPSRNGSSQENIQQENSPDKK